MPPNNALQRTDVSRGRAHSRTPRAKRDVRHEHSVEPTWVGAATEPLRIELA